MSFKDWLQRIFHPKQANTPAPVIPLIPGQNSAIQPIGRGTISWYKDLWFHVKMSQDQWVKDELAWTMQKIISNIANQYQPVQQATKVPWQLISAFHYRESNLDFSTCLHNGDPLGQITTHVPKGRGPFNTWKDAAIDALKYDGLADQDNWTIAKMLMFAESYNGTGYLKYHQDVMSPYLWSGTNFYLGNGKYTDDGKFNPKAKDDQIGVAAILLALQENNLLPFQVS